MNKNNEFEFEDLKNAGSTLSVHTGDPLAIKEMQKSLNAWGYTDAFGRKLSEDGDFGINTFNSVIKFQMDNDLVPDGIVGDKTWQAMSDRKKKEEGEIYTNPSNIDSGAVAPQSDVDSRENVNNPRKHGAFATIDKAFDTSPAKGKENTVTEDDLTEDEDDFESLKEKGSVLSVHSGSPYTIKELQKELNSMGYTDALGRKLSEDGIYGTNTFNSVIKFQMDNDLVPDGVVGDKTWKAMSDKRKKEKTLGITAEKEKSKKSYDGANAEGYHIPPKKTKYPGNNTLEYKLGGEPKRYVYETGKPENTLYLNEDLKSNDLHFRNSDKEDISFIEAIKKSGVDTVETIKENINAAKKKVEDIMDKSLLKFIDSISNSEKLSDVAEGIATLVKGSPDSKRAIINTYSEMYDFENDSPKDIMIGILDESLKIAENNNDNIALLALNHTKDMLYDFDISTINEVYYMNDSDGAKGLGHSGILLVNKDGESILFSYYPQNVNETENSTSEMRISVLDAKGTKNFLSGSSLLCASTSGENRVEQYDRTKKFDISPVQGISMLQQGVAIAGLRPNYDLTTHNCDHMALSILWAGSIISEKSWMPDKTFENMGGIKV